MNSTWYSHAAFVKVWSNVLFLIPAFISLHFEMYLYTFIVTVTMVISMVYHYYDEKRFKTVDMFTANLLIISNLYLCYLFNFAYPYFHIALVFLAVTIYFFYMQHKSRKDLNHALWHISSVAIASFCILGYGMTVI